MSSKLVRKMSSQRKFLIFCEMKACLLYVYDINLIVQKQKKEWR